MLGKKQLLPSIVILDVIFGGLFSCALVCIPRYRYWYALKLGSVFFMYLSTDMESYLR